jgi:hypothetical protein
VGVEVDDEGNVGMFFGHSLTLLHASQLLLRQRGHSPSKTGVNALVIRASIMLRKRPCEERWIAGSSPRLSGSLEV